MIIINQNIFSPGESVYTDLNALNGDPAYNTNSINGLFSTEDGLTESIGLATRPDIPVGNYCIRNTFQTPNNVSTGSFGYNYPGTAGETIVTRFWMMTTQTTNGSGATAWTNFSSGNPDRDYLTAQDAADQTWVFREYTLVVATTANCIIRWYSSPSTLGSVGDTIHVSGFQLFKVS